MNKIIVPIICFVLIIYLIFLAYLFICDPFTDYEDQLGIRKLIHGTYQPIEEKIVDGYIYKYYDDICLVFYESGGFVRSEITGDKYKLDGEISVGSKRSVVEEFYSKKPPIKDLEENQFGFIEDYTWVHFYFDEFDKVEKILIYTGP